MRRIQLTLCATGDVVTCHSRAATKSMTAREVFGLFVLACLIAALAFATWSVGCGTLRCGV